MTRRYEDLRVRVYYDDETQAPPSARDLDAAFAGETRVLHVYADRSPRRGRPPSGSVPGPRDPHGDEMYERWRDGETQEEIASDYGLSRERVRQIIVETQPSWLISLTKQLHAARTRHRGYVRDGSPPVVGDCWVCGASAPRRSGPVKYPTCDRHRGVLSGSIRTLVNLNGRRDALRAAPSQRQYEGLPGTNHGQRWLQRGSGIEAVVLEAVAHDWPLVALLPTEIVSQARIRLEPVEGVA